MNLLVFLYRKILRHKLPLSRLSVICRPLYVFAVWRAFAAREKQVVICRPLYVFAVRRAFAAREKQVKGNSTRTWCMVKPSTSQEKLDDIIQYCCTQPKIFYASVAMNICYHISGKHPFNSYFTESGLIVTQDPYGVPNLFEFADDIFYE
ncbi:Glucan endo-1,3-beta-D-glucosidase [Handroanthus impetiginosus]|uniref:Glucan endo-1,3-beta-D-glucosidase n=1 Tax=Handroanthus impetiginosus TaxID=429701 RepID=A0A2G9FYR5_9LAMI|nr:Glucan endo-1,3-beta-D-glucosidase [Handroanthus impetiginosus]PIN19465.1 Glucan endo-1,3-beta-D-glucosidase [Handroanthus impetiginosus]